MVKRAAASRATDHPDAKFYSVSTINRWGEPKIKANDAAKIGSLIHYNILDHYSRYYLGTPLEVPLEHPYWTSSEEVNQKIEDAMWMWKDLELEDVVKSWKYIVLINVIIL